MRDRTIILDINNGVYKILKYKQFDNNNSLKVVVKDDNENVDITEYGITSYFRLPSGIVLRKECSIIDVNIIEIMITSDILSQSGIVSLEITLSNNNQIITSFRIDLNVEESINRDESIILPEQMDVASEIENIKSTYATKEYVDEKIGNNNTGGISNEQLQQLTIAYEHSQTHHVSMDDIPNIEGLATETYVKNEIEKAQLSGGEIDTTNYVTKEELNTKADKSEIPTRTSDLENDNNFISSIPSEYVTEEELNDKGYLTEHQDISHLATKNELHTHNNKIILDGITEGKIDSWDNKSDFNGDYNSLTNKPTIPNLEGYATESYVKNEIANAQLGGEDVEIDLSGYATKDELNAKASIEDIPTKVSQLENDSKFITSIPSEYITETELNQKGYLTEHQNISHLALKSELHSHNNKNILDNITQNNIDEWNNKSEFDGNYNSLTNKPNIPSIEGLASEVYVDNAIDNIDIPNNLSDLNNDVGYITNIPSEYITETELDEKGYLTQHQDISHLATKNELNTKANTSDIPTKVSQLENDSKFITSIPSEYITETELNQKGYLTEHQDISGKADKTELHNHTNKSILDNITQNNIDEWNNKSEFDGNYNSLTNKPTIPNLDDYATISYVDGVLNPTVVTKTISSRNLTLSTDKYQFVSMANNTTIKLPTVSTFTEIHLFFNASSAYTITFPSNVYWQENPSVESGAKYEFIFTYVNSTLGWLGGFIKYVN